MKALIFALATVASFSAQALESHYGSVSFSGGEYHCTYTNNGGAKNMKYVFFAMERRAGKTPEFNVQNKIDTVVAAGETIIAHSGMSGAYKANLCKFMAR